MRLLINFILLLVISLILVTAAPTPAADGAVIDFNNGNGELQQSDGPSESPTIDTTTDVPKHESGNRNNAVYHFITVN